MKRSVFSISMLVLLAVGVASAWWLRSADDDAVQTVLPLHVEADCDSAQRHCRLQGDGLEFELSLGPMVRPMETFAIMVRQLRGDIDAEAQIEIQFYMRGMEMGLNRYRLVGEGDGIWRGQAILPVCSSGRSDWLAQVTITTQGKAWQAQLPFVVGG